jgi:hypothetical protein
MTILQVPIDVELTTKLVELPEVAQAAQKDLLKEDNMELFYSILAKESGVVG